MVGVAGELDSRAAPSVGAGIFYLVDVKIDKSSVNYNCLNVLTDLKNARGDEGLVEGLVGWSVWKLDRPRELVCPALEVDGDPVGCHEASIDSYVLRNTRS